MSDQRTPLDKGAVSDEQREMWKAEIRGGREPYVAPAPERSRMGKFLGFLERLVGAGRGAGY